MGVKSGSIQIAQIEVQALKDDLFFDALRHRYSKLRGFLRRWFGIWRYAHCDFIKARIQGVSDTDELLADRY